MLASQLCVLKIATYVYVLYDNIRCFLTCVSDIMSVMRAVRCARSSFFTAPSLRSSQVERVLVFGGVALEGALRLEGGILLAGYFQNPAFLSSFSEIYNSAFNPTSLMPMVS